MGKNAKGNMVLEDRIKAISDRCAKEHSELELTFDPVDNTWNCWLDSDSEEPTFVAESFEEIIEALEAEFNI